MGLASPLLQGREHCVSLPTTLARLIPQPDLSYSSVGRSEEMVYVDRTVVVHVWYLQEQVVHALVTMKTVALNSTGRACTCPP